MKRLSGYEGEILAHERLYSQEISSSCVCDILITNSGQLLHPHLPHAEHVSLSCQRIGLVWDTGTSASPPPYKQGNLKSVITIVFLVCGRRTYHKTKASLNRHSHLMGLTWCRTGRKFVTCFLWTLEFNTVTPFWKQFQKEAIGWLLSALVNLFRIPIPGEPLRVSGPEHTSQAEYFESPFKSSKATCVEAMGLETGTAVSWSFCTVISSMLFRRQLTREKHWKRSRGVFMFKLLCLLHKFSAVSS